MRFVRWMLLLAIVLTGCQQQPTKIYRAQKASSGDFAQSLNQPIEITVDTQLVDARPRLATGLAKISNAIPLQWDDFTRRLKSSRGILESDLEAVAKRLALKGLTPDRPVVVIGEGKAGKGEEGRVAWMLMYLGFSDVQTTTMAAISAKTSLMDEPPIKNEKSWSPKIRAELLAESKEVMTNALGKKSATLHLIDVRTPKEYFARDKKTEIYLDPDLRAINIEWKEFFTNDGRPNPVIRAQMEAIGLNTGDRIVVISNEGVRSGAVTYALTMIGYKKAGNYAAGWKSLK